MWNELTEKEDMSNSLPAEAFINGYRLIYRDNSWNDLYDFSLLKNNNDNIVFQWYRCPSLTDVFETYYKIKDEEIKK